VTFELILELNTFTFYYNAQEEANKYVRNTVIEWKIGPNSLSSFKIFLFDECH
jgi:hypothetical protein